MSRENLSELDGIRLELKTAVAAGFSRSFHLREVDTGSCGGCESEIISTTNPLYDVQSLGVDFVASPRHADAIIVTGPVSKNMELALKRTYEAMPEPKLVITAGDCAYDGGIFKDSYYVVGGVNRILPVNLHIPGCPPGPVIIMKAILQLIKKFEE